MNVSANGINFNVSDCGTGEPALVFLHFFGGSSRSWDEVIARLPDFRCIAPDLRGFGASDAPANGYSVDEQADDVAALLDALGIGRFVLVGHSMGGKIALNLAARRPEGLQYVVLLAPSPPTPEPIKDEERQRLLDGFGQRDAIEHTLRAITTRPLSAGLREIAVEDGLRASFQAWQAWLEHGSREDIGARMKGIEVPVLVVAGKCDNGMTPELLKRKVAARIDGAQMSVVSGAGHLLPLEAPAQVAALIRDTLVTNETMPLCCAFLK